MKVIFKKVTGFVLTSVFVFVLVACSNGIEEHKHNWSTELTSDFSSHWYKCTSCDEIKDKTKHSTTTDLKRNETNHWKICDECSREFEIKDHRFGNWTEITTATEENEGLEKRICNVCGYEETNAIPKLNHTHKFETNWTADEITHWHAATCSHDVKDGESEHSTNAGRTKDETNHWKVCDECSTEYEIKEHDFGGWEEITAATEESEGIKKRVCDVCGYEETNAIPKLNHTHKFETNWTADEITHWHAATCGHDVKEEEAEHSTTTVLSKDKTNHWKVCDVCGEKYEVTDHTEDEGTITTAPTCVTKGEKTYKCSVCKEVLRTEEMAALGHKENSGTITTPVTVKEDGVRIYNCSVCDIELRKEMLSKPILYETPLDAETKLAATKGSTYILFGVFPKSLLASDSSVTVDETVCIIMGANTYYRGSDGNYYAKVISTKNDTESYFKVEPIKWKVLTTNYNNTGNALLFAEDILTGQMPYYASPYDRKIGKTIYPNNYKYSTVRAYLNGKYEDEDTQDKTTYTDKGFLQTAFTTAAQSVIVETEVDNSKETTGYSEETYATNYACENTIDKIFLLSESEVININYGFAEYNSYGQGNTRIKLPTDYAKANYAFQSITDGYGTHWWLRSPYYDENRSEYAHYVNFDGQATYGARVYDDHITGLPSVVPALSVSLK